MIFSNSPTPARACLFLSFVLVSLTSVSHVFAAGSACDSSFQAGHCSCNLADGRGVVDLTSYAGDTLRGTDPDSTWKYDFAFCRALNNNDKLPTCYQKASVCQWADWSPDYDQVIGEPASSTFEMRTGGNFKTPTLALVTQTTAAEKIRSVAFLTCDQSATSPVFSPDKYQADKDTDDFLLYFSEIKCDKCCPGGAGGLSAGSVLLIIFFVLLTVYFVGGFLVMTFVQKREGIERIPHRWFWADLPYMARDGFFFALHKARGLCGGGGGHQEIK